MKIPAWLIGAFIGGITALAVLIYGIITGWNAIYSPGHEIWIAIIIFPILFFGVIIFSLIGATLGVIIDWIIRKIKRNA